MHARLRLRRKFSERHRHRYEFNNDYRELLTDAGLIALRQSRPTDTSSRPSR